MTDDWSSVTFRDEEIKCSLPKVTVVICFVNTFHSKVLKMLESLHESFMENVRIKHKHVHCGKKNINKLFVGGELAGLLPSLGPWLQVWMVLWSPLFES